MDYKAYIRSPEWRAKRQWALERAGHRCQLCNRSKDLEVHHRTYERLGAELPGDLIVLDHECHSVFHEQGRIVTPPTETDPLTILKRATAAVRARGTAA